jgi:hypothetical protein
MLGMKNKTSITVSKKTRDQLAEVGDKDSTFDGIIRKMIKKFNEGK